MKDQQFQAFENFQETYKQFRITMKLTKQNSSLEINVENTETLDKYFVQITMKYIQQEKEFVNIFVEPIEIMDYIIHHFKDVVVEDGVVRFQYLFGTIKKRAKSIAIKLDRLERDPLQLAELKIKKLSEALLQSKQRIKEDQQQMAGYKKQIHKLQQIVEENHRAKRTMSDQIQKLNYTLHEKLKQIQNLKKASQKFTATIREKLMRQEMMRAQTERLNQVLRDMAKKQQTLVKEIERLSHSNNRIRR